MLRISIVDSPEEQKLVLQGKLTQPWVSELEALWSRTREDLRERKCVVDLKETTSIDQEGFRVLEMMCKEGARFIAKGVMTKYFLKCLMDKISKTPAAPKSDSMNGEVI